jgi:hypothetical protein
VVGVLSATPTRATRHLRWVLLALALLVTAAHLWLTQVVGQAMLIPSKEPTIQKMKAAFVTEMRLSRPPVARAAAPAPAAAAKKLRPKRRPPQVADAASAASQPEEVPKQAEAPASAPEQLAAAEPAPGPAPGASSPEAFLPGTVPPPPAASKPLAGAAPAGTAASAPQANPQAPTFIWPKATRVSYKMQGHFRGPIYGQASVEWLREGMRYQVFVEASVGPSFAPLGSWRLSSEGDIRPEGLYPRRYENFNRLLTRSSPVQGLQFDDDQVTLANGNKLPRTPDMQDPASQFIQLAYLFMLNPNLLMPGNSVYMPMVWLKKSEVIAYDVLNEEVLHTPLGDIPTYHVRPRRMEGDSNNMSAEIWFAPGLQYLPVRILTRANDKTYMDMQMDQAPQQAPGEPPAGPVKAPSR